MTFRLTSAMDLSSSSLTISETCYQRNKRRIILSALTSVLAIAAMVFTVVLLAPKRTVSGNQQAASEPIGTTTMQLMTTDSMHSIPTSCQNVSLESATLQDQKGGIFDIALPEMGVIEVYCDLTTDGGNWIVFQRRMDGSVNFNLNWGDYVDGFGHATGEFWLGLEALHVLTAIGEHELRIDMIERDGPQYYAKYNYFSVGPAWDNYRLTVYGYTGNATDSLYRGSTPNSFHVMSCKEPTNIDLITGLPYYFVPQSCNVYMAGHNGEQFSTKDADHDGDESRHCASAFKGGWWYQQCHPSNLNGVYNGWDWDGIVWVDQGNNRVMNMQFTEIKFRLKNK